MRADPEAAFEGRALLSAECDPDQPIVFDWQIQSDPLAFFTLIRTLPAKERDTMISYFILRADQKRLARVMGLAQQSQAAAIVKRARARLTGQKMNRTKPHAREVETVVSPDHLGMFRVAVEYAGDIFAASSTVRSGESADYGSDRF